jgi:hypothetical protein
MTVTLPANITVEKIERRGGGLSDGYGQPKLVVAYSGVRARLERTSRIFITVDGSAVQVDADISIHGNVRLLPDDRITLDTQPQEVYTVLSVDESQDLLGRVVFRSYALTRKRGTS